MQYYQNKFCSMGGMLEASVTSRKRSRFFCFRLAGSPCKARFYNPSKPKPGLQVASDLTGSKIRLQDQEKPTFFFPYQFLLRDMMKLGKAPANAMLVVFILKGRPSNQLI